MASLVSTLCAPLHTMCVEATGDTGPHLGPCDWLRGVLDGPGPFLWRTGAIANGKVSLQCLTFIGARPSLSYVHLAASLPIALHAGCLTRSVGLPFTLVASYGQRSIPIVSRRALFWLCLDLVQEC
ncbi:hypothetical protein EJ03DRAFT_168723 [Teratosphaeria nubilosa]|uniref:Uncharacterized protein n=1 Tax=Teratosphaeria nubilosa TaxID=161662 RepID=A0A6G1LKK0_9PEZI|nr:hypothetical protein EJ03DRAFT_168723 [Teratosphaeria nubilosa]